MVEAGPTRRVENLAQARTAIEISAAGRVVMPGFVDSHTHLLFPFRPSCDSEPGASEHALRSVTGMRLETQARVHLEAMARHGTTTVEVKTECGPESEAELKLLRVLEAVKWRPLDIVPTTLLASPPSGVAEQQQWSGLDQWLAGEFLPKVKRRRLASFADVFCENISALSESWSRYLAVAQSLGLGRKVHAEGPASEAVALAVKYGAASVDHLEYAGPEDIARLGSSETVATLLPAASFHRDARYAPARALIDAGAAVALGTNFNPHHTPTLNMQAIIKLACCRMGMTPAEAVCAATINAAHALGCAGRVGSLEPGKSADLLILNISDYRELAHHFGMNLVHRTMKRGEIIWDEGQVAPRAPKDLRPAW